MDEDIRSKTDYPRSLALRRRAFLFALMREEPANVFRNCSSVFIERIFLRSRESPAILGWRNSSHFVFCAPEGKCDWHAADERDACLLCGQAS